MCDHGAEVGGDSWGTPEGHRGRELTEEQVFLSRGETEAEGRTDWGGTFCSLTVNIKQKYVKKKWYSIVCLCIKYLSYFRFLFFSQHQARELQGELGECKITGRTLEKMLVQKEQQLLDLQEQCGVLQAAKDELQGELQHLKTQHYSVLKEAREQAHEMIVSM